MTREKETEKRSKERKENRKRADTESEDADKGMRKLSSFFVNESKGNGCGAICVQRFLLVNLVRYLPCRSDLPRNALHRTFLSLYSHVDRFFSKRSFLPSRFFQSF